MSAGIIIGNKNSTVFAGDRWWPEGGLIHSRNIITGEQQDHKISEILHRLSAINDMIKNSRGSANRWMPIEKLQEHERFRDAMILIIEEAQRQGDQENPKARKQKVDQIKADRGSRHILIPGVRTTF